MTADQGFELHPGAANDITEIWEYIASDNPLAARRLREDILNAIRKLVLFPYQGHQRPDLTSRPLRFQTVRNSHRLRARRKATRRACCASRSTQSSGDRRDSSPKEVIQTSGAMPGNAIFRKRQKDVG